MDSLVSINRRFAAGNYVDPVFTGTDLIDFLFTWVRMNPSLFGTGPYLLSTLEKRIHLYLFLIHSRVNAMKSYSYRTRKVP